MDYTVNYLAVVVAAVVGFIIGFLWHGPLFGKTWLRLSGISEKQAREAKMEDMWKQMLIAFICQLIMAYVIAMFVSLIGIVDVVGAVMFAFWAWLGFLVTTHINGVLWEKKSVNLFYFSIVYLLVLLVVQTIIIAWWQ